MSDIIAILLVIIFCIWQLGMKLKIAKIQSMFNSLVPTGFGKCVDSATDIKTIRGNIIICIGAILAGYLAFFIMNYQSDEISLTTMWKGKAIIGMAALIIIYCLINLIYIYMQKEDKG